MCTRLARFLGVFLLVAPAVPRLAAAQVELDRILVRVNARIITASDVRQARLLQLVDNSGSDDAALRALEDRLLILDEIARSARVTPSDVATDPQLAAHRREWETRLGGSAKTSSLLAQAGMSEAGLQSWLRDDLSVRDYLTAQFGSLPQADRQKATADWLARLRQRAGLK